MTNIILCGGSGTRLWPISRSIKPKQFIKFFDEKSLFQMTVERNMLISSKQFIVSNAEQYFLAIDQLKELDVGESSFLLEPIGRNTAPAIALACFSLPLDEVVLVTPSDHLIKNTKAYIQAVKKAMVLANEDNLVTFGISPKYAETGYGYIESNNERVERFHEKPDIESAKEYLKSGNFYWNSGIFCFKVGVFLKELKQYSSSIYEASKLAFENAQNDGLLRISHEDMLNIPEDSIDYAVMEKSTNVKMVQSDIEWSDLGSFESLYEELNKDKNGNTQYENLYTIESKNNFIYAKDKVVALIDIEDLVVVDSEDALLISKRGSSQKVKKIVERLKANQMEIKS